MRQRLLAIILMSVPLAVASPALADPVRIVSNESGLGALAIAIEGGVTHRDQYPFTHESNHSVTAAALVGSSTATAFSMLTSSVADPSRLRGTAATSAGYNTTSGIAAASATSQFLVFFELAVPHTYRFEGDFVASGDTISKRPARTRASGACTSCRWRPI
jgi:hypothetical protein